MSIQEMFIEVIGYQAHINPIDVRVAVKSTCEKGHNMEYRGFSRWIAKTKHNSYRAFAICRICDIAEEF